MRYVLAPLAGFTDAAFRRLCFEGGADFAYTEMVSAAGLAHGSSPTRQLMETMPGEGALGCQIFGANESDVAYAAGAVPDRFSEINLNAGCPVRKVVKEGAGAKLAEDPEKVYRLLRAMKGSTRLPVTLKTRLGPRPDRNLSLELLDAAERAGAAGVVFHARFTSQMHGGATHLDLLAEIAARAKVPVTGNGSVVDAKSAAAMAATGVDAIMVGRAALADPFIFARLKGNEPPAESPAALCARHLGYLLDFRDRLAAAYPRDHVPPPDSFAAVKMHTHLFRYFNGRPGAAKLRARLNSVRTLAEIYDIIHAYV